MPVTVEPWSRANVRSRIEGKPFIRTVEPLGPGLSAIEHPGASENIDSWTSLMEKCGWYVAEYDHRSNGPRVALMPITEGED